MLHHPIFKIDLELLVCTIIRKNRWHKEGSFEGQVSIAFRLYICDEKNNKKVRKMSLL